MKIVKKSIVYILINSFLFIACTASNKTTKVPITKTKQIPVYKDIVEVNYYTSSNDPFSTYSKPVEVAIIRFSDVSSPYNGKVTADNLYSELSKTKNIHEKFTLFPDDAILTNLSALGLRNFDPTDKTALKKIYDELDIKFIISGYINYSNDLSFNLIVRKTENGQVYLNQEFKKSEYSTAIKDAVNLLAYNNVPSYSNKQVFDYNKEEKYTDYEYQEVKESNSGTTWVTIIIVGLLIWAGVEGAKKKDN